MAGRFFSGLACLIAFLSIGGCAHNKKVVVEESTANYFGASKVHRFKLTNGLKVLILEDHSAPTFAYQTWFDVGSKDERPGRTGLAHLFEHMMFKATKNLADGEFFKRLEMAGSEGENAFTSRDFTGYVQSLPSDKLELIASMEADRMVNLIIDNAALDKEREVVQNERRFRNENSPNGKLFERIYTLAYTKHSYRWPVIGYADDLKAASREDCEDFYRRFYAPNNATVVIVGDVTPSRAMATITKYYGKIPSSKIDRPESPEEPAQKHERSETIQIKSPVEKLVVGYHIPNVNSPDFAAIEAAREILAGGKGSRLYRKLVDGGIATSVDLESAEHEAPGLLLIFVNLQKGKSSKQALEIIDREIRDMAAGNITDVEIQKAISMHRFVIFDDQASNYSKAQFMGFYETVAGNFERGVQIVNSLTKVTKPEIVAAVKSHFTRNNRNVVIGAPGKGK